MSHLFTLTAPKLGDFRVFAERGFAFRHWVEDCGGHTVKLGWLLITYDSPSLMAELAS